MKTLREHTQRIIQPRRGAALYIMVMITALLASVLGHAALNIVRIERRVAASNSGLAIARVNARAAAELALRRIADDENWRTTYTNGVETVPESLGANATGTLSFILEDSDGSLTDADTDLRLKGVGRVGNTVQVLSVKISRQFQDADYLRCPIHVTGRLTLTRFASANGGPFSSNTEIRESNGFLFSGNAEAPMFTGDQSRLSGTFTTSSPKPMPPGNPFDDIYKPLATEIAWSNLPTQSLNRKLTGTLSSMTNPFSGTLNPKGIYFIRVPAGRQLSFEDFSLYGTLVLEVEHGGKVICEYIDHMEPHSPRFATMLIKPLGASLTVEFGNSRFFGGGGITSEGLIHVIGVPGSEVEIGNRVNHTGTIFVEGASTTGEWLYPPNLKHDPALQSNPPLGYASENMGIRADFGTWMWDAAP